MARPRIGITSPTNAVPLAIACLKLGVWLGGGRPVTLSAKLPYREMEVDGLLLGGGSDIFPELYQSEAIAGCRYDRLRDELEVYWLKLARERNLPVLAICRGAQMMNVVHGGTLHLAVREAYEDADYPSGLRAAMFYRKSITVKAGSHLHRLLGADEVMVNSIHKQAINRVGDGLAAVALEPNGVIQAVEDATQPFYIGVQFHPEFLLYQARHRRLFRALVDAA
ncbi:MAG: gamma-glutamyl-gamma-aminobutyrate hydrolase family protein [Puniceicoccales bacterium]